MAAKIKAKRVIGIWNHSLEFACANNLQGIFFDNFIYSVEELKEFFGVIYHREAIEVHLYKFFKFLGRLIDDNSVSLSEYIGKCAEWYYSKCKRNDFLRFLINNLKRLYKEKNDCGVLEPYIQSIITNV